MEEQTNLRCNSLGCRKILIEEGKADIFCIECASDLFEDSHRCPACQTNLLDPNDIILSTLAPTEEFKNSCLAGMTPALVLDIAGRALNFWQYQRAEEASFQAILLKDAQEKLAVVENRCEAEAKQFFSLEARHGNILGLQMQINNVTAELHSERRKVQTLIKTHHDMENEMKKQRSIGVFKPQNSHSHIERVSRSATHLPSAHLPAPHLPQDRPVTPTRGVSYAPMTPSRLTTANIYAMQNAVGQLDSNGRVSAFGFNRNTASETLPRSPMKRTSTSSPIKTHHVTRRTYLRK
ncbi:hypothetical protein E3P99_03668 [Wallemia hederae]|uniref:RING-type domain-containing protein n=1 Tax=Wallemia hederae TaxID=1540922 RepID=A0A4T0FII8_9BASI|nr:hypothetical protein E3P99_03668 [Wallemia hederae]